MKTKEMVKFENKLKVVGYLRVSSIFQVQNGISLPAQREKIEAWAKLNNAEIIDIFSDEGLSGTRSDRPGFNSAMNAVIKNQATLVVFSLTRFGRSTQDIIQQTEKLRKAGCNLISLSEKIDTTTASGKMVFRMLAVLAEFERDQVSERTKAALQHRRNEGKKLGGIVPYGYNADADGKLSPNPKEKKVIKSIMDYHNKGWKVARITEVLNSKGIKTKTGKQWSPQTVKNIILTQLRNE